MAVLRLVAPHWQPVEATAQEIVRLEQQHRVDAVLIVALGEYESRWTEGVVNPSSGTVGLLQIQPANFPACRSDEPACAAVRARLAGWRENLRIGVSYYAASRRYCLRRGRGGEPEAWLQGPLGFDSVRRTRCGWKDGRRLATPAGIVKVLRTAASLRHAVSRSLLARTGPRGRSADRIRVRIGPAYHIQPTR